MRPILELRHLRTLLALRNAGSLTRAAELLNLTQSALSQQIRQIEEHYGGALFERKSIPIAFTAIGRRLLKLTDTVLPTVEEAERDIVRLLSGIAGELRIAVECHTCFDWLMPAMDAFRERWPEIELDIVSGFHPDPVALLHQARAEVAIVSEPEEDVALRFHPLFSFEIVALLANEHALTAKPHLEAVDFAGETLLTYPVEDDMLDLVRQVLRPAGVHAARRTTELTVAMLQLVASGRGIAALPLWAVQSYLERGYVTARPIGAEGLTGRLYAATTADVSARAHIADFVRLMREQSFATLPGIRLL